MIRSRGRKTAAGVYAAIGAEPEAACMSYRSRRRSASGCCGGAYRRSVKSGVGGTCSVYAAPRRSRSPGGSRNAGRERRVLWSHVVARGRTLTRVTLIRSSRGDGSYA